MEACNCSCDFPPKFLFTIVLQCTVCRLLFNCCPLIVKLNFSKVYIYAINKVLWNLLRWKVTNKIYVYIKCYKDTNFNCSKEQLQQVRKEAVLLCPCCALKESNTPPQWFVTVLFMLQIIFIACIRCWTWCSYSEALNKILTKLAMPQKNLTTSQTRNKKAVKKSINET